jgi:hypothetical protein
LKAAKAHVPGFNKFPLATSKTVKEFPWDRLKVHKKFAEIPWAWLKFNKNLRKFHRGG